MTEAMKDRPELLKRRGPKPAPDEAIDPVDAAPAPRVEFATSHPSEPKKEVLAENTNKVIRKGGRREVTIPLGTRLSVPVMDVLDRAVAEQGITIREALEQAIMSRWGKS